MIVLLFDRGPDGEGQSFGRMGGSSSLKRVVTGGGERILRSFER